MGPFIVELFTFGDFTRYPSQVDGSAITVTSNRLPTPAHVQRTRFSQWSEAHWRICNPIGITHLLRNMTALTTLLRAWCQSLSASPSFRSPLGQIGSNVGITLKSDGWDTKPVVSMKQDYSDEPPSSKASYSRSTSLYRHSPQCAVNYIPLAMLVRHGLPGRLLPNGKSPILALPRRRHVKQSFTNHDA